MQNNEDSNSLTRQHIEQYGLSIVIIEATNYLPSFAYSIGLWETYKHPEIICFGFSTKTLHILINDVSEVIKRGSRIMPGEAYDNFLQGGNTFFVMVNPSYLPNYFGAAIEYYGSKNFEALQFVWPDRKNKFPWQPGFEKEFIYKQPLLDRNTDFKFREARNVAIFTTKQWLEQRKPITKVVHDNDGDWQFLTGDQMPEDICIVALEQMAKSDPTLNEIFNLDYGEYAERNFIGDIWVRGLSEIEEDEMSDDESAEV
jgi:hypothetical protein